MYQNRNFHLSSIILKSDKKLSFKSSFRDYSSGIECVLVQMRLIQTLSSELFYIRKKVILSSIRRHDFFVCRVNRFRVIVDLVRHPDKFQIL